MSRIKLYLTGGLRRSYLVHGPVGSGKTGNEVDASVPSDWVEKSTLIFAFQPSCPKSQLAAVSGLREGEKLWSWSVSWVRLP